MLDLDSFNLYTKAHRLLERKGFKLREQTPSFWYFANGGFNPYTISLKLIDTGVDSQDLAVEFECLELNRDFPLVIEPDNFTEFEVFVSCILNLNALYGYYPKLTNI